MAAPLLVGPAAATFKAACAIAWDYGPTAVGASLATVFVRRLYSKLPSWIKQDEAFQALVDSRDHGEEIMTLTSVIEKLQDLFVSSSETLEQDEAWPNRLCLQATFLCYLQLALQLRRKYPQLRNHLYQNSDLNCPHEVDSGTDQSQPDWPSIREALDWSVWAYDEDTEELRGKLEATELYLMNHGVTAELPPGFVGHFTALNPERKLLLIGVKGTSSLEDLLTDCCGKSTPFTVKENMPDASPHQTADVDVDHGEAVEVQYLNGNRVYCHEGILIAAKRLVSEVLPVVKQLMNSNYRIVICGHSLGAGVASLMGLLLKSQLGKANLHVYAFACPPVLDLQAAKDCAPFCTTIVNHADMICRSSLANLQALLELLRKLHQDYLVPNELSPTNAKQTIRLFRKLLKGDDGNFLMTQEQVNCEILAAQDRFGLEHDENQHLYVPGKVILLYKEWQGTSHIPAIDKDEIESVFTYQECYRYSVTEPDTTSLRFFDIGDGSRMVTDHLTLGYYEHLDDLLEKST